ncbi:MAG: DUF4266 domain-containing protein [Telluria sp.]
MKRILWLALACLAGCTTFGHVEPWQKGTLARSDMGFDARLEGRYDEHVATSREAANGGAAVGAGGCGCN